MIKRAGQAEKLSLIMAGTVADHSFLYAANCDQHCTAAMRYEPDRLATEHADCCHRDLAISPG